MKKTTKVALIGNPNAGKTSLFNNLTGLNQKVGNYPGVTVEKKTGKCRLANGSFAEITDFPGTYSINPKSLDEHVVFDSIFSSKEEEPDLYIVIVDETNLKRNLLLFTQIKDLGKPVILALNMVELARNSGIYVDAERLRDELKIPIIEINARTGDGIEVLKKEIQSIRVQTFQYVFNPLKYAPEVIQGIKNTFNLTNDFRAYQIAAQHINLTLLNEDQKEKISTDCLTYSFDAKSIQGIETIERYRYIDQLLDKCVVDAVDASANLTEKIDKLLTHKIWGYAIFGALMFLIFQIIFSVSSTPMEWIDSGFIFLSNWFCCILLSNSPNRS